MSIRHPVDRLDMQRVDPRCILTGIRLERWHDDVVREGYLLALLTEYIVAIHILKGIDAVRAWCHTLDNEAATAVGTAHTKHGLGTESRIGGVAVQTYENALDGLQVF